MRLLLAVLALVLFAHEAFAQDDAAEENAAGADGFSLTDAEVQEALDFAVENVIFVLYHEIGHLFVGEYGIPVLGREEDAADNLAAVMLLEAGGEAADAALIASADGWYWSSLVTGQTDGEGDEAYKDVHSLDIQRSYSIVCLMVGKDAEYFSEIADVYELAPERQESCAFDYAQARGSWTALLAPFRRDARPDLSGEIAISYEEPGDYRLVAEAMQARAVLEDAKALVGTDHAFAREIVFEARQCGEQNAYYNPSEGKVTLCYELADFFMGLYISNVFLGQEEATGAIGAQWLDWGLAPEAELSGWFQQGADGEDEEAEAEMEAVEPDAADGE